MWFSLYLYSGIYSAYDVGWSYSSWEKSYNLAQFSCNNSMSVEVSVCHVSGFYYNFQFLFWALWWTKSTERLHFLLSSSVLFLELIGRFLFDSEEGTWFSLCTKCSSYLCVLIFPTVGECSYHLEDMILLIDYYACVVGYMYITM